MSDKKKKTKPIYPKLNRPDWDTPLKFPPDLKGVQVNCKDFSVAMTVGVAFDFVKFREVEMSRIDVRTRQKWYTVPVNDDMTLKTFVAAIRAMADHLERKP